MVFLSITSLIFQSKTGLEDVRALVTRATSSLNTGQQGWKQGESGRVLGMSPGCAQSMAPTGAHRGRRGRVASRPAGAPAPVGPAPTGPVARPPGRGAPAPAACAPRSGPLGKSPP